MKQDLTTGNVTTSILKFAAPLIIGNILQQIYSITDTLIVGKWIGSDALAAVGSTYTLTTFLYSVIIGMCMGSGGLISYYHGKQNQKKISAVISASFLQICLCTFILTFITLACSSPILRILQTPAHIFTLALGYTRIVLVGIFFIFLFNYFAYVLRAMGNSIVPMTFLAISTTLNIILDLIFVILFHTGVEGAATATLIAQVFAGIGIFFYTMWKEPLSRLHISSELFDKSLHKEVLHMSFASSIQQSVMNFGILMIQGLVNSFGAATMAAFTVAVKIDTLAYMPAQEFSNAFSLFISQNYGAKKESRIRMGSRNSFVLSSVFCVVISLIVYLFASPLMSLFLKQGSENIIQIGVHYLRIEGLFYLGIGLLFLFYGYFRGVGRPEVSILLTIISLGTRVLIAYAFAPIKSIGVVAIWMAIPIGWFLADLVGFIILAVSRKL